jgi:hypothetical protein
MLRTYTDRGALLDALLDTLDRARGRSIVFGKYSPAPLPATGPIMRALRRLLDEDGEILLVIRRPLVNGEWIEAVRELLTSERTTIAVGANDCPYFPPALVVDESEVFMHLSWPSADVPQNPYLGMHLRGSDVELAANALRRSLALTAAAFGS